MHPPTMDAFPKTHVLRDLSPMVMGQPAPNLLCEKESHSLNVSEMYDRRQKQHSYNNWSWLENLCHLIRQRKRSVGRAISEGYCSNHTAFMQCWIFQENNVLYIKHEKVSESMWLVMEKKVSQSEFHRVIAHRRSSDAKAERWGAGVHWCFIGQAFYYSRRIFSWPLIFYEDSKVLE